MDITWTMKYIAEFLGMAILVILCNGVVTNVVANGNGDRKVNRLMVALGYGFGVMVSVLMFASISGSHLNPAITVGLAASGYFEWGQVIQYVTAQFLGAIIGQLIIVVTQYKKYNTIESDHLILSTFATVSDEENRNMAWIHGGLSEFFGSFIFVFGTMFLTKHYYGSQVVEQMIAQYTQAGYNRSAVEAQASIQTGGAMTSAIIVLGLLTVGLVMIFGGGVGPALNPARDLGPRLVYTFLPNSITGEEEKNSQWWYAFVPVIIPFIASACAVFLYKYLVG